MEISFTHTGQWLYGNKMQARRYYHVISDYECHRHHLLQKSNAHQSFISAQKFQIIGLLGPGMVGVFCKSLFPAVFPTSSPTGQLQEHLSAFPCASCTLLPACHLPSSPTQSSEDMVRAMCHGQSSLQSPLLTFHQHGSHYANHGLEKHRQGNAVSFRRASLVGCFKREGYSQLASALPLSGLVNILLALETVFPMSARERRLDFLVWCRCFLSSV